MLVILLKFLSLHTLLITIAIAFEFPVPEFEVYPSLNGFSVSIPDKSGIEFFGFHGAINRYIKKFDFGDFHGEVISSNNNRWTYENSNITLNLKDTIYFWFHVQLSKQGYDSIVDKISVGKFKMISSGKESIDDRIRNECDQSSTIVDGFNVCSSKLIFADNFNTMNWTNWEREIRIPLDSDDGDFVSFQDYLQNLYVNEGKLFIQPTLLENVPSFSKNRIRHGQLNLKGKCTGKRNLKNECYRKSKYFRILPPVVSAKIKTKITFQYGQFEVRAKLPIGDWIIPHITLEPLENFYGNRNYSSGQIRIAFARGNQFLVTSDNKDIDGRSLYAGVILNGGDYNRNLGLKSIQQDDHFGNDFHVYSLTWTEESISLAVDGTKYGTIEGGFKNARYEDFGNVYEWQKGGYMAPFDREFYISLGVSVGGISDFPDNCKNGENLEKKPWTNRDPKCEFNFWLKQDKWSQTWAGEHSSLVVDYIRVRSL